MQKRRGGVGWFVRPSRRAFGINSAPQAAASCVASAAVATSVAASAAEKREAEYGKSFMRFPPSSLLSPFLAPRFRDCLFGGAGAASNSKEGKRKIRRGRRLNNVFPRTDRPNDRLLARSASVDRASGEEGGSSKSERRAIAQRSGNRFGVGGAFATLSDVGRSFSRR